MRQIGAVTPNDILALTKAITNIEGLLLDSGSLAEDIAALAIAYPNQSDYQSAGAATVRALNQLINGQTQGTVLRHDLEGWFSLHYQSKRSQKAPAGMRIVYKKISEQSIEIRIFGNRHLPENLY